MWSIEMSKERELLKRVRDTLRELKETHYDLYWDIQAELDLDEQKPVNKELALRILKLLSGLEMYVFMQSDVPDYHSDELIAVIGELTDIVLDKPIETDFLTASKYSGAEYTNPHKHNNSLFQNVGLKETK